MKIASVEFVASAGGLRECPNRPLSEIAISGRSNVGKSSLLNSVFGRRKLAHVSGTPGKTQRLHFYLVNENFHLVDLPGYGYARVPAAVRNEWTGMMQGYLQKREQLQGVVQLVDARHAPSREDKEMVQWLLDEELAFCLVPTKMDKLRQSERKPAITGLLRTLHLPSAQAVVPFSTVTGEGREPLLDWLERTLAGEPPAED